MGLLKRQVFGEASGKVGHVVFKKRGDITYISGEFRGYTLPQDERSVRIRNRFSGVSKLAVAINSVSLLKQIWAIEFPKCYTTCHQIFRQNFPRFTSGLLSGTPCLTPNSGFSLNNPKVEFSNNELIIHSGPLSPDSGINTSLEKYIIPASVFLINTPNNPKSPITLKNRIGDKILLDPNNPLRLMINLNAGTPVVPDLTRLLKSWTVLITLDEKNNPVDYSELITWPQKFQKVAELL